MKHPRNLVAEEKANPLAQERRKAGRPPKNPADTEPIVVTSEFSATAIHVVARCGDRIAQRTIPRSSSPEAIEHTRAQLEYQLRFKQDRMGYEVRQ